MWAWESRWWAETPSKLDHPAISKISFRWFQGSMFSRMELRDSEVVSIRGISPQSSGATVATYIDDIPFGGSSALSETAWYWPDIDPADLERVEVLKGPQGTLYGASSLGGVIKYVTRPPSLTTTELNTSEELNEVLGGGSPGTKVRASVATPIIANGPWHFGSVAITSTWGATSTMSGLGVTIPTTATNRVCVPLCFINRSIT